MLYMIQVWGENQETYVKIGFSDDIDKRLATYKNCNPLVRILGTTEGGLIEEKKIHLYLKDLGYKANFLDEWFKVSPEVLNVFEVLGEEIDSYLWEHRGDIWESFKEDTMTLKIYEDLKSKYLPGLENLDINNKADDKYFKFRSSAPEINEGDSEEIKEFLEDFNSTGVFAEKLRLYCEFSDTNKDSFELLNELGFKIKNPKFKIFYDYFGTSGCKAKEYRESVLTSLLSDSTKEEKLKEMIYSTFKVRDRYTIKELKKILGEIYSRLQISKTPKATDLKDYFKLQDIRITDPKTGKRVPGFKLN